MRLKLRAKTGSRLEILDEAGQPVEGVFAITLEADAPDFIPRVSVQMRPSIMLDIETAKAQETAAPSADEVVARENADSFLSDK